MERTLRLQRPVIAITGSAGKSTTKEMIASILSTRWKIFKSIDNRNFVNHTRKYAKSIRPSHRAVVLEYGMAGPHPKALSDHRAELRGHHQHWIGAHRCVWRRQCLQVGPREIGTDSVAEAHRDARAEP
nr:Mur ligase family protein [Alicyclobacillus contaminans]